MGNMGSIWVNLQESFFHFGSSFLFNFAYIMIAIIDIQTGTGGYSLYNLMHYILYIIVYRVHLPRLCQI